MIAGLLFLLLAFAAAGAAKAWQDDKGKEPFVWVNDEPVDFREFQMFADRNRAQAFSYFRNTYGVNDSEGFWMQQVGGEIPGQYLFRLTMEELVRSKIQQLWAKQEGVMQDATSYEAFLDAWQKENRSRQKALASNQVIYGPRQYDAASYYLYLHSNLVARLKEHLGQTVYAPTDKELNELYQNHQELYTEEGTAYARMLLVSRDPTAADEGRSILNVVQSLLKQGIPMKEVMDQPGVNASRISYAEQWIGGRYDREEAYMHPLVKQAALSLSAGQISEVHETEHGWMLVQAVERTEAGVKSYEEVKENVFQQYVNMRYEEELTARIRNVKTEGDPKNWKRLQKH